jgi:hypothetical protein
VYHGKAPLPLGPMTNFDEQDIFERIFARLDSIKETTTETKTLMTTLVGQDGRIPKLEEDVNSLNQFKWKITGIGAVLWAAVEFLLHGKH